MPEASFPFPSQNGSFKLRCPTCKKETEIQYEQLGKIVFCSACDVSFVVPDSVPYSLVAKRKIVVPKAEITTNKSKGFTVGPAVKVFGSLAFVFFVLVALVKVDAGVLVTLCDYIQNFIGLTVVFGLIGSLIYARYKSTETKITDVQIGAGICFFLVCLVCLGMVTVIRGITTQSDEFSLQQDEPMPASVNIVDLGVHQKAAANQAVKTIEASVAAKQATADAEAEAKQYGVDNAAKWAAKWASEDAAKRLAYEQQRIIYDTSGYNSQNDSQSSSYTTQSYSPSLNYSPSQKSVPSRLEDRTQRVSGYRNKYGTWVEPYKRSSGRH